MAKGRKTGGRRPGSLDKKTLAKLGEAGRQAVEAKKLGRKKATEVLDDLMHRALAMAAQYQPTHHGADPKDAGEFKDWMMLAGRFARDLAPYQEPRVKFLAALQPPPIGEPAAGATTIDQEGNVLDIEDPKLLARAYAQIVRRVG